MSALDEAKDILTSFEKSPGSGSWPHLPSADVIAGARARLDDPGKIRQGAASLCGPASMLFCLIKSNPKAYAWYVTHLWTNGTARIGALEVKPGLTLRTYKPPADKIHPVDWMTLASLRDSENAVLSYDSVDKEAAGITMPSGLAGWFKQAGFSDTRNETNILLTKSAKDMEAAKDLRRQGYRVCLFINGDMLEAATQDNKSIIPNHWVVLNSAVEYYYRDEDMVSFKVFTWGNGAYTVPQAGHLKLTSFVKNFYGYVATK